MVTILNVNPFGSNPKTVFELLPELGEELGCIDTTIDEQFPHIKEKILFLWGSVECADYLDSLLNYAPDPQRPNSRQGFPFQTVRELNIIQREHDRLFPYSNSVYRQRKDNPWR